MTSTIASPAQILDLTAAALKLASRWGKEYAEDTWTAVQEAREAALSYADTLTGDAAEGVRYVVCAYYTGGSLAYYQDNVMRMMRNALAN